MLPVPYPLQHLSCKAGVDKFALKLVFKVRRPSLPGVEGTFQSRIIRSGSGCLRSACNIIFSLALAVLRGTSCGKQSPSPANCTNSISERFFPTQCHFLMSPLHRHLSRQHQTCRVGLASSWSLPGAPREGRQGHISPTRPVSRHVPVPCFNYFLPGIWLI